MTRAKKDTRDGVAPVPESSSDVRLSARMQLNPEPLKLVDATRRRFWEELADEVDISEGIAPRFRKRWTKAETVRVISASPDETYEDVAREINRSPGAVRYRRMAMIHLLREEHGAPERVQAYADDPKANHKFHDYYEVHVTLQELGLYDLPAWQQLELARELRQPSKSWRGDGTAAALAASSDYLKDIRERVKAVMVGARKRVVLEAVQQPSSARRRRNGNG